MYDSVAMSVVDPAGEYLRLAEHYRQMNDEELLELIPQRDELTPAAQQALAIEVRQRGLKVEMAEEKPAAAASTAAWRFSSTSFKAPSFRATAPKIRERAESNLGGAEISTGDRSSDELSNEDEAEEEDPYEEDRRLFTLCTVWSLRDALKVQRILDVAGIPFYMGPEKATSVDQVKSDFSKGVGVQIMRIGWPWSYNAMKEKYFPQDAPPSETPQVGKDLVVRCPRCQSTEVVFKGLSGAVGAASEDSPRKFRWTCEECGKEWEDEGVANEE